MLLSVTESFKKGNPSMVCLHGFTGNLLLIKWVWSLMLLLHVMWMIVFHLKHLNATQLTRRWRKTLQPKHFSSSPHNNHSLKRYRCYSQVLGNEESSKHHAKPPSPFSSRPHPPLLILPPGKNEGGDREWTEGWVRKKIRVDKGGVLGGGHRKH